MPIAAPPAETAWLLRHAVGFDGMDEADVAAVLEEATRTAEGVLAPLDAPGDRAGALLVDGAVRMPEGFAEAFASYAAAGWIGIAADAAQGGQGLADVVALAAFEPVSAANMAFGLCPMLTQDAIKVLAAHGTAEQQARLMRPMIEGRWTGTMCLTEPQAGSDLSGVRTKAEPAAGGLFRVSGQKVFITYGEHPFTENILHLVLARLPGAPSGSSGISLFAVPKMLADGTRNEVRALSLEHKLGIRASPTCVMGFEGALGEMIGAPNRGLPAMFAMMNAARLGVAMQGVAVAERAFRRAVEFAGQRAQSGAMIDQHPDVRRMLLTMRALALGGRLLTLYAASVGGARGEMLIPVAKAWCTDAGVEAASLGVQVHGGMGFIEATGAAQHWRDARIAPIYEGTNGIQAITLLKRGLLRDQGEAIRALLDEVADTPALAPAAASAAAASAWLRRAEPRAAEAGASAFLAVIGTLAAGWLCARVLEREDAPVDARRGAQVFLDQVLPRVEAAAAMIARPSAAVVDLVAIG